MNSNNKISKASLNIQKKWQDVATKLGGGQVVLKKQDAKRIIYNLIKDSFRPMNITMIHETLKGKIPSPLLKASLDDMVIHTHHNQPTHHDLFFRSDGDGDSDKDETEDDSCFVKCEKSNPPKPKKQKVCDEHDHDTEVNDGIDKPRRSQGINKLKLSKKIKKNSDDAMHYTDCLVIKEGRNVGTSVYYFNQFKLVHNGDHRHLLMNINNANAEKGRIERNLQVVVAENNRLQMQPPNIELNESLLNLHNSVVMLEKSIRIYEKYKSNAKKVESLKLGIEKLTMIWRTRKRMCIEFVNMMEEHAEGSFSAKQCFSGFGPIYLEADE